MTTMRFGLLLCTHLGCALFHINDNNFIRSLSQGSFDVFVELYIKYIHVVLFSTCSVCQHLHISLETKENSQNILQICTLFGFMVLVYRFKSLFSDFQMTLLHFKDDDDYIRKPNIWKILTFFFIILSVILLTVLVSLCVMKKKYGNEDRNSLRRRRGSQNTRLASRGSDAFSDLSIYEIEAVVNFLNSQSDLRLVDPKTASVGSNFIHSIEMKLPDKEKVLRYIEENGEKPERRATVYIFRGADDPPVVDEYVVGDLPNVTYGYLVKTSQRQTRVPFIMRPFSSAEFKAIFRYVLAKMNKLAWNVLKESYDATIFDCDNKCLRFNMAPIASSLIPKGTRKAWFWLQHYIEYPSVRPVDFQFLVDMTSTNPAKWKFENVWYANQMFQNVTVFLNQYKSGNINKTKIPFPTGKDYMYGSMEFREPLMPEERLRAPRAYEPDGHRYKIIENEIQYMQWKLNFRVSASGGLHLMNIRFGDERLVYELSMQEVAVLYSGNNPASRIVNYADGAGMYGTRYRGLLPGVDCPGYAEFIDTYMYTSNEYGGRIFENAFCVFEHNTHTPVRRHRAYGRSGAFYGGLEASCLTVRAIISVLNYDYIFDFKFYQTGGIETRVSMTGYLGTTAYFPEEDIYGAHVHEYVSAGLHNHLFHFKADLDVKGTSNRYETVEIRTKHEMDPWVPGKDHYQPSFSKHLKLTELSSRVQDIDFSVPKYHIFSQNQSKTKTGLPRSLRLVLTRTSKQLLPEGYGFESAVSWARNQIAVTKHKDDEERSSSLFTMWDARDPVVNFQKYLDDDENIVDQVIIHAYLVEVFGQKDLCKQRRSRSDAAERSV